MYPNELNLDRLLWKNSRLFLWHWSSFIKALYCPTNTTNPLNPEGERAERATSAGHENKFLIVWTFQWVLSIPFVFSSGNLIKMYVRTYRRVILANKLQQIWFVSTGQATFHIHLERTREIKGRIENNWIKPKPNKISLWRVFKDY